MYYVLYYLLKSISNQHILTIIVGIHRLYVIASLTTH